jgi:hypothetical protein
MGTYCLHYQGDELLIALMMEAVRTSETSVYYSEITRRNIPEGSNLHIRLRENLKSHKILLTGSKQYIKKIKTNILLNKTRVHEMFVDVPA